MYITTPYQVFTDYVTAKDRGLLASILKVSPPESQTYAELTSEGVTFFDSYKDLQSSIQISPPEGEEFGTSDVIDIINRSPVFFGEPAKLAGKIRGQLDSGVVVMMGDHAEPMVVSEGRTLKELRDTYGHSPQSE